MPRYEDEPTLDVQRAASSEEPRRRSHKDRRRWCRGKVGVEHVAGEPELSSVGRYIVERGTQLPCRWTQTYTWPGLGADRHPRPRGDWRWQCSHIRRCTTCGKALETGLGRGCPDYATRPE